MDPLERHALFSLVDHMQTIVDRLDTMLALCAYLKDHFDEEE